MLELIYYLSAGPGKRKKKRPNPFREPILGPIAVAFVLLLLSYAVINTLLT